MGRHPQMSTNTRPPTPDELHKQFRIPREYIRGMAAWMNISESMMYMMYKDGRNPGRRLAIQLERRCSIPERFWTDYGDNYQLDTRNKILYSMWYNAINPNRTPSPDEPDLVNNQIPLD
jgi:hypothetical protein